MTWELFWDRPDSLLSRSPSPPDMATNTDTMTIKMERLMGFPHVLM
jgi:hypothetical protein